MKKIIAYSLILSMLVPTGIACFAGSYGDDDDYDFLNEYDPEDFKKYWDEALDFEEDNEDEDDSEISPKVKKDEDDYFDPNELDPEDLPEVSYLELADSYITYLEEAYQRLRDGGYSQEYVEKEYQSALNEMGHYRLKIIYAGSKSEQRELYLHIKETYSNFLNKVQEARGSSWGYALKNFKIIDLIAMIVSKLWEMFVDRL